MSLATQRQLESTYVMQTYDRKPVELVSGAGMELTDSEGQTYLDFVSGVGAVSLGHCHPHLVETLKEQSQTLIHVSNYYYIKGRGELAQTISDLLSTQEPLDSRSSWQSFFANSGAEANECAFKLARLHAKRQAFEKACNAGAIPADAQHAADAAPRLIVTLDHSFHGRTLATLAATAQPAKQEAFKPLPDGFIHTPLNDCAALETLFSSWGTSICAVMVECVQGESGVHPCSSEFLQCARRLSQHYNALLMCDEIQCGIYRLGTYPFGFQHFGITPDVVTMAKGIASGIPMGVCAAKADVAQSFHPGDHGSTFGGSCVAIAAANATLATLEQDDFARSVAKVGTYFQSRLAALPSVVSVRGLGLMVAADLSEGIDAFKVVAQGLNAHVLLNATGPHTLRFLPPLICTEHDIDLLIERLGDILKAFAAD